MLPKKKGGGKKEVFSNQNHVLRKVIDVSDQI